MDRSPWKVAEDMGSDFHEVVEEQISEPDEEIEIKRD
jgi:hypothetical protein